MILAAVLARLPAPNAWGAGLAVGLVLVAAALALYLRPGHADGE